ncbi:MAG: GEVED domain-containing protein [Cyclobacteriaceae bacterium]|nr:GEVED domain-containing protein [Cyclobacteriaceae bacterium]
MKTNQWHWKALLLAFLLSTTTSFAQTSHEKQTISNAYNQVKLDELRRDFKNRAETNKEEAVQMAAQKGWDVYHTNINGSVDELIAVSTDGKPIYYTVYNVNAAISTRANRLNIGGSMGLNLDGQNMTAYVWDGGPTRPTHQEFDGAGGNNRVIINDGVTGLNGNSFHSMHVTGTVVASGFVANAKGMAPQAKALTHDWTNDLTEATTEAASGMLLSNHSYGYRANLIPDWYFGAYIADSRDWDNLMYNSPYYLMVVAAGNDGNDNTSNGAPLNGASAYDKLSGMSTSKNNMVVANGQDANINADGSLNSVTINSSSSEGPTDDMRIKPDITGNGTSLYSTYDNADNAYNSITGTSMASPNVTGTLLLLQQHYNNVNGSFMRAATLKGLALHTADDAGITGPDAIYGWGLLNAKAAAEAITANGGASQVQELTLSPGQTFTLNVDSDGSSPLLASISWTDPAGTANTGTTNLTTPVLVNDLDIRVSQSATTYSPYKLTAVNANAQADNNVDPYERVDIASATGTYTITVTHKGTLSGGSQNFSLVVTGLGASVPCTASTPTGLAATTIASTTAGLNWNAVAGATYDVRYRQTGTTTWTTNAVGSNSTTLTGLAATTQYEVQVRSKCAGGSNSAYSASVTFTTTNVQLTYCSSNGNNLSDEYIGRVQLGTINNATGASSGGYGDYTSISTNLAIGSSNTITITPTWTGTIYSEGYSVWIDYNRDGDFADAGEQVYSRSATTATPVNGNFTVPTETVAGVTTMRVSMKYNGVPTACESFTYGEVEDYAVNITGAIADTTPPSVPTGLASSNITINSVDLSWNASTDNTGVTGYDVYQDGTLITSVTSTSYAVTGLASGTTFAFMVTAKDAAGNVSAASNAVNVTTDTPDTTAPTVPTGLATSNITQTSLTLTWNASTDAVGVTGYDVYQDGVLITSVTNTTLNISGLTPGTSYAYTVRSKDAAGNISAASAVHNVTTVAPDTTPPSVPTSLAASAITQTTLTLSWNASTDNIGVTGYDVYQDGALIGATASTSMNISGLSAGTIYAYTVRAKDAENNMSAASAALDVTTDAVVITYCSASGNNVNYEYIDLVQLGSINNATGANGGYGDFTSQSTILVASSSNTINFSAGFSGTNYSENWKVFIDYNQDGDFADAGENVVTGSTSNAATASGTFTVPSGATLGSTRMRVVMAWNATPNACGTFTYGEVEDYTVTISATVGNSIASYDGFQAGNSINPDLWSLSLQTYPNPVINELTFNFSEFKEVSNVRIFNTNGVEMQSYSIDKATSKIEVSRFATGVYILFITTERGPFETQFIKK